MPSGESLKSSRVPIGGGDSMATFTAFQPVNLAALPGFSTFNQGNPSVSPGEIDVSSGAYAIHLKSAPHNFGFDPIQQLPTGTLSSVEVDFNGSIAYTFTGLSVDIEPLARYVNH